MVEVHFKMQSSYLFDNQLCKLNYVEPTTKVFDYLRRYQQRTGTEEVLCKRELQRDATQDNSTHCQIDDVLAGNLYRRTGYRPIITASEK